jgi:tRNA(fMet)-specific endonuclease VapC
MKYLLDTNICVHFFRGKFGVFERFEAVKAENCAISEITLAELVFGAENSKNPEKNHRIIEHFVDLVAVLPIYNSISTYGKEKARLRKTGTMISDLDLFIGCTAIENDLIMVTENEIEFERLLGIQLENWVDRMK